MKSAYSISRRTFVNNKITSRPDYDPSYDISLEPWCVDRPALCGNFVDIGVVELEGPFLIEYLT
ncbi:hypothetical protein DBT_1787 [Dissulfuribacter thermophilus]|uniref:Uncharacterized protein n=1 Tax=Dissulfuribacter thermophilus TaxID=1156395 RepID=A0A1B9F452_9BACT|nr:hypothetical protein [Dissulfuribacter thermophilus]OCC14727.1 hypothetical protein DBT_1787 [Dissulfuribacter thermophilus]